MNRTDPNSSSFVADSAVRSSSSASPRVPRLSPTGEGHPVWQDPHHLGSAPLPPLGGGADVSPAAKPKSKKKNFNGRVQVLVRCRPLIANEHGHSTTRVHTTGNTVVVNDPIVEKEARQFTFDAVLSPDADQATTFAEVEPLIDHVLDGFHATVFAYGQTGSGKTHTMEGLSYIRSSAGKKPRHDGDEVTGETIVADVNTAVEEHGIMPRAIQLLFDRARLRQGNETDVSPTGEPDESSVQYAFRCSYYQIYNEVITDLLRGAPPVRSSKSMRHGQSYSRTGGEGLEGGGLKVRWQKNSTFRVQNLFVCECESPDQMREALFTGVKQKVLSSHLMNDQSSRSHCVFTVYVECRKVKSGDLVSRSEFSMVDLAGSEKLHLLSSRPSAKLMKESIEINTSLLALGKVITALAANSQRNARLNAKRLAGATLHQQPRQRQTTAAIAAAGHVPYRDSKLTMLLKHALGGNSLTLMVACITPSDRYVEETVSTLLYAGRASNIENIPHVNEDPTAALIKQLREEVRQLKEELKYYRALTANGFMGADPTSVVSKVRGKRDGTSTIASDAPDKADPSAVGATVGNAETHIKLQQQSDDLADSLLAACDMLKQLFATNGHLRDAYDVVKEAKEAADVREVQLNAENIALRERIQLLESIVLKKDARGPHVRLNHGKDDSEVDSEKEVKRNQGASKSSSGGDAPSLSGRQRERSEEEDGSSSSPCSAEARRKIDWSRQVRPLAAPATISTRLENLVEPEVVPRAVRTTALPEKPASGERRRKSEKKKEKSQRRKEQRMNERLEAYEDKYHNLNGCADDKSNYAAYYGRAAKASHKVAEDTVEPLSSNAVRRQLVASRADIQHAVSESVVAVQSIMKALPDSLAAEVVPRSLKNSKAFGTLSFCGGQAANAPEFEAKRQDREARRQALLQRQQQLLSIIHTDITERRFYDFAPPQSTLANAEAESTEEGAPSVAHPTPLESRDGGKEHEEEHFQPPTALARKEVSARTLSHDTQSSSRGVASRLFLPAERARPRWESGVSLESVEVFRQQRHRQASDLFAPRGVGASPVAAPARTVSSPYDSTGSFSLASSLVSSKQSQKPHKTSKGANMSSMEKLLRYLREQRQ